MRSDWPSPQDELLNQLPNLLPLTAPEAAEEARNPFDDLDTLEVPVDRFKFQLNLDSRIEAIQLKRRTLIIKRGFDLLLSAGLILVTMPLLLLAMALVWLIKGRQVILREPRFGRLGRPFNQYILNVYQRRNRPHNQMLHWLHRCGFRLLPSLFNIFKGEMSFVGPEPATAVEYRSYNEFEFQRLRVRPGLTCFWFLRRHANLGFDEKIPCDIGYVKKLSLTTDLGILVRSVIVQLMRGSQRVVEDRLQLLGVKFFNLTMRDALDYVIIAARRRSMWTVSFINADCLNIACQDREYFHFLQKADAVFPDGIGIHLASRFLGVGLKENTNGTDFFPRLCREAAKHNLKIFLLGGEPGVAEAAARSMRAIVPNVEIVGTRSGYFADAEEAEVLAMVNDSGADILLVGMGVPRQEKWIAQNRVRLTAAVVMGVGGLFDFYSGKNARAPIWMREIGLEWLYRIGQEPGRMWRRYVVGNPLFLYRVWRFGSNHPSDFSPAAAASAQSSVEPAQR